MKHAYSHVDQRISFFIIFSRSLCTLYGFFDYFLIQSIHSSYQRVSKRSHESSSNITSSVYTRQITDVLDQLRKLWGLSKTVKRTNQIQVNCCNLYYTEILVQEHYYEGLVWVYFKLFAWRKIKEGIRYILPSSTNSISNSDEIKTKIIKLRAKHYNNDLF